MAKFNLLITYACGHENLTEIYCKKNELEKKEKNLTTTVCKQCYYINKCKKDSYTAYLLDLPELIGSEKQILFANSIRVESIDELEDKVKSYTKAILSETNLPDINEVMKMREDLHKDINVVIKYLETAMKKLIFFKTETIAKKLIENRTINLI